MTRNLLLLAGLILAVSLPCPCQDLGAYSAGRKKSEEYRFTVEHADVPLYPLVARMARVSGTVRVDVTVRNGAIVKVEATSGSNSTLAQAAIKNAKTWQFLPDCSGKLSVTYVYELKAEQEFPPPNSQVVMRFPSYVRITAVPAKPRALYQ